jgi:hypothetical protein
MRRMAADQPQENIRGFSRVLASCFLDLFPADSRRIRLELLENDNAQKRAKTRKNNDHRNKEPTTKAFDLNHDQRDGRLRSTVPPFHRSTVPPFHRSTVPPFHPRAPPSARGRPRVADRLRNELLELGEVLPEHSRELLGLLVVRGLVRPRISRIENVVRDIGHMLRHV